MIIRYCGIKIHFATVQISYCFGGEQRVVEAMFSELFHGEISPMEAGKKIHQLCNQKGINPALELPITMLMLTKQGQTHLKIYEEFIMQANWLLARVSAQEIAIGTAVDAFVVELERVAKEMLNRNH